MAPKKGYWNFYRAEPNHRLQATRTSRAPEPHVMSKTKDKLDEAKFFLKKIEGNYLKHPDFDYFLNAFISSSRSVLWVMKSEYIYIEDWQNWYNSRQPTDDEEKFFKNINDLRVRSQKLNSIQTNGQVTFKIKTNHVTPKFEEKIDSLKGKTLKVTVSDEDVKNESVVEKDFISFPAKLDEIIRVVDEFPDEDILLICKKYLCILQSLVKECEDLFVIKNS